MSPSQGTGPAGLAVTPAACPPHRGNLLSARLAKPHSLLSAVVRITVLPNVPSCMGLGGSWGQGGTGQAPWDGSNHPPQQLFFVSEAFHLVFCCYINFSGG